MGGGGGGGPGYSPGVRWCSLSPLVVHWHPLWLWLLVVVVISWVVVFNGGGYGDGCGAWYLPRWCSGNALSHLEMVSSWFMDFSMNSGKTSVFK